MKNAVKTIQNFGGRLIIIGNYPINKNVILNPWDFIMGKIVSGAWVDKFNYDNNFMKFYKNFKDFKWKKYFGSKTYKLTNITTAFMDFKNGKIIRPLIKME